VNRTGDELDTNLKLAVRNIQNAQAVPQLVGFWGGPARVESGGAHSFCPASLPGCQRAGHCQPPHTRLEPECRRGPDGTPDRSSLSGYALSSPFLSEGHTSLLCAVEDGLSRRQAGGTNGGSGIEG
jgi:hypothetical protein